MREYTVNLLGKPITKLRPRFLRSGGAYDPQSKVKKITKILIASKGQQPRISGPVAITINFFMPYPKSWSKKKKADFENIPHTVKFDIDNMVKFYLDCMNEIVFDDDKQVTELHAYKCYSDCEGYTVIKISA